jgi:hypothetical protein
MCIEMQKYYQFVAPAVFRQETIWYSREEE